MKKDRITRLRELFLQIYDAVVSCTGTTQAPVAYIRVAVAGNFEYSHQEMIELFNKLKWDSVLSAADVEINQDDTLSSDQIKVFSIEDFKDDEGNCEIFHLEDGTEIFTLE